MWSYGWSYRNRASFGEEHQKSFTNNLRLRRALLPVVYNVARVGGSVGGYLCHFFCRLCDGRRDPAYVREKKKRTGIPLRNPRKRQLLRPMKVSIKCFAPRGDSAGMLDNMGDEPCGRSKGEYSSSPVTLAVTQSRTNVTTCLANPKQQNE